MLSRKKYFELWFVAHDGTESYLSQHTSALYASEAAHTNVASLEPTSSPETLNYEIRIGSEVLYTMALISHSLILTPDDVTGDVDSGTDTPDPDVVIDTIPDYMNQPEGTPFSVDIRAGFLTGDGAATGVISIIDVSDDSAATLGLAINNDDDMETSAGTVGQGVFQINVLYDSVNYRSNSFTLSVVAVATDTEPPTKPLPVSLVRVGTTGLTFTYLPGCDPKSPGSTADGMASSEIWRSKAGAAAVLRSTEALSGPGLSVQFSGAEIGTHGVTPTFTQDPSDATKWTITAEGVAGLDSLADEFAFLRAPVTGNFDLSGLLKEYTAPVGSKTLFQLMVRQSQAQNAKFITCGRLNNDRFGAGVLPIFSEVKWRPETGASIQFANPQIDLSGDYYFWINRTGNILTCRIFQQGFAGWTLNRTETIIMTGALEVGVILSSGLPGAVATGVVEQLCLQNLGAQTFEDTGLDENTLYEYHLIGVSN